MLQIAVIALLIILTPLAALLVYAATRPNTLSVRRSIRIAAPPEAIFKHINDFHRWVAWSPYEKKDLTMKRTLSGAQQGRGALYAWDGNNDIGQGTMEIVESSPPSRVAIRLCFTRPFQGENDVLFALQPDGDSTAVTWSMTGKSTFMSKLIGIFLNMDKMIGNDFEAGLASLKAVSEQEAKQPASV
jgi:hypothetical protein